VKPDRVVDELTRAAQRFGIRVRVAPFQQRGASAGGVCRVAGKPMVLLDELSSPVDRAYILADALLGFDLRDVNFSDEASAMLNRRRGTGGELGASRENGGAAPAAGTTKPGLAKSGRRKR
jgi:hypothetical protein